MDKTCHELEHCVNTVLRCDDICCFVVLLATISSFAMAHAYVWHDSLIGTIGWLQLVGSLKLYVSFAKEPYKRDYILQKRPAILRSLLIVATPYRCQQLETSECMHVYMYVFFSSISVIRLIHMCDMTHGYVWHDSLICLTRLTHMCDMTHWYI